MVNVIEMLRGVTAKKIDDIEEIADRLYRGEKIPGEVIHAALRDAGRTPEDLQAMIDGRGRIAGLVKIVKDAPAAERRLAVIDKEIADQQAAFDAQRQRLRALAEKHEDERDALKRKVSAADAARNELLAKGTLPAPLWERLQAADQAVSDAENAYQRVVWRQSDLNIAADDAAVRARHAVEGKPVRHEGRMIDVDEARKLEREAVAARDSNEAEKPKLEAAFKRACEARDATRVAILKELGA